MLCKMFLYFSSKKNIIFLKHGDSTSLTICKTYFKTGGFVLIIVWFTFKEICIGRYISTQQRPQQRLITVQKSVLTNGSIRYILIILFRKALNRCTYVLSQVLLTHHLDCHSHAHLRKEDKANSFFLYFDNVIFQSAYEQSGLSGRRLTRFQWHEATRSISTPVKLAYRMRVCTVTLSGFGGFPQGKVAVETQYYLIG